MGLSSLKISLFVTTLGVCAFGCGATKTALQETNRGLENDLARLKAETARLRALNAVFDDERMLLKKRVERCEVPKERERKLAIVRLSPDDAGTVPEGALEATPVRPPSRTKGKSRGAEAAVERPRLALVGRVPATSSEPSDPSSSSFLATGADNLGVVAAPASAGPAANEGPMEAFNEAYRSYINRAYDQALASFAAFAKDNPQHDYADNALFWRGECFIAKGQLLKAIGELERLLARYPASDQTPSALYRIGFSYDQLSDRDKALEYYFRVVEGHPGSDAARKASARVAVLRGQGTAGGRLVSADEKR